MVVASSKIQSYYWLLLPPPYSNSVPSNRISFFAGPITEELTAYASYRAPVRNPHYAVDTCCLINRCVAIHLNVDSSVSC